MTTARLIHAISLTCLFAGGLSISEVSAQTVLATACIGDDLSDLEAAAAKDPENIGLLLRLAQKKLARVREVDIREARSYLEQVEKHVTRITELGADFVYPYRALAKSQFKRDQFEDAIKTVNAFRARDLLDFDLNTLHLHALLHLATQEKDPQPARRREAADYVATWFDSGSAPPFGTTLGALRAWVIDAEFRDELLQVFADRYKKNPRNLNLVISYIACLAAVGRYESAWSIVQEAERLGLCDAATGARHPVTYLLSTSCPEVSTPESYDGSDLEELKALAAKFPENASLSFRCAAMIKNKANAQARAALILSERVKRLLKDDANAKIDELQIKQREFETKAAELYAEALPYALKVNTLNGDIETVPLMLGDIYYKLKRYDEAITELNRGLKIVPFFVDLREALAFVYKERKDWKGMAEQLALASRRSPCMASEWDRNATDSLLPRPKTIREKMIVEMVENPESRGEILKAYEAASSREPQNPNLRTFLAMVHYFSGNQSEATTHMLAAERLGMCGKDGFEHELATLISARKSW